jgi:hypothetical protein
MDIYDAFAVPRELNYKGKKYIVTPLSGPEQGWLGETFYNIKKENLRRQLVEVKDDAERETISKQIKELKRYNTFELWDICRGVSETYFLPMVLYKAAAKNSPEALDVNLFNDIVITEELLKLLYWTTFGEDIDKKKEL